MNYLRFLNTFRTTCAMDITKRMEMIVFNIPGFSVKNSDMELRNKKNSTNNITVANDRIISKINDCFEFCTS